MVIGPSGWPSRSDVETAWRAVASGQRSREDVHDWSVPWIEGDRDHATLPDPLVLTGLTYLHGLDMTVVPERPGALTHGGPGPYLLSDGEVADTLAQWLRRCHEYDQDPEGFRRQNLERALAYREADRRSRRPGLSRFAPADRAGLGTHLHDLGIPQQAYSLTGGHPNEAYVLDQRGTGWVTYYSERGQETTLRSFDTEQDACQDLLGRLIRDLPPPAAPGR